MSSKGIIVLALIVPAVFAQSPPARNRDDLDVTMHVIVDPDAKVPDEIVRRIPLPKPAQPATGASSTNTNQSGKPSEPGAKGQERANEAREKGREFGKEVSEEAKQRSEEARHNKGPPPGKPPKPGR